MSSLQERRNSPRRNPDQTFSVFPLRVAVLMYSTLPLIVFVANGDWEAGCITLGMLHWAFRPLKGAWL